MISGRSLKLGISVSIVVLLLGLSIVLKNVALLFFTVSAALFMAAFFRRKQEWLLLMAGSVALALMLGELAGSLLLSMRGSAGYTTDHYALYNARQELYGRVPSQGSYVAAKESKSEVIYKVVYTIGNDGFRITPSQDTRSPDVRINFFGGSHMFGEGLNDAETLPYYVSRYVPDVSVKNYGMHGWGVHNALAIFEDSDVRGTVNVLLTSPFHALRSACVQWWTADAPQYQLDADGKVEYIGRCGRTMQHLFKYIMTNSSLYSLIVPDKKVSRKILRLYLAIIAELKAHSERNGQKLVVGYLKLDESRFSEGVTNSEVFDAISDIADEVLDVTLDNDSGNVPRRYILHELDKHPTAAANAERAKLLLPALQQALIH